MNNPFEKVIDAETEETFSDHLVIDEFRGKNEFLSNFFMRPFQTDIEFIDENGEHQWITETFQSVEHAFQASKVFDRDVQKVIRDAATPRKTKKLGRKARLRPDWEEVKVDIMERIVSDKFAQHKDLQLRLLFTGNAELIEGNTWNDDFWGVINGKGGKNHLGKILMRVRDLLTESLGDFETVFKGFLSDNHLGFLIGHFNWEQNNEQETSSGC